MNKKKIVLFAANSSYSHTNSAVRLLKKYYESLFGYDTVQIKIIEKNIGERDLDIINELCLEKADLYGFSVYIWNRTQMISYSRTIKELLPSCKIFFGGPEISYEKEEFFSINPHVESIINGEGEKAFVKLVEDFLLEIPLEKFYGGEKLSSEEFEALGNAYEDEINQGTTFLGKLLYFESVRGCPYSCSYCLSCDDKQIREKSVDATLFELEKLRESGAKTVKFVDRTFNYDKERAKLLITEIINRNFPFCCHFEICAFLIDDQTIDILKKASEDKIRFECGVQSTNVETLKAIKRTDKIDQTLVVIDKLRNIPNLTLHLDLIAGLPCETFESFSNGYNALFGKCDMLQVGFLKLLKGTPMRDSAEGYVFLHNEPYTVLKTPTLLYEQMNILNDIAYLTDKYVNTQAFSYTFDYITIKDPFSFMCGLRKYILNKEKCVNLNKKVGRRENYEYLLSYLEKDFDAKTIASCLRLDFILNENTLPPLSISPCDSEKIDDATRAVAESFIRVRLRITPSERGLLYVGRFLFMKNKLVICNRKSKEVYVLDK